MNEEQVRAALVAACAAAGSLSEFARRNNVHQPDVSKMCTGTLTPMGGTLRAIGYRRVVLQTFVPADESYTPPPGFDEVPQPVRAGRPRKS